MNASPAPQHKRTTRLGARSRQQVHVLTHLKTQLTRFQTGDGFIVIDSPKSYGLPLGKQTSNGQVYDISLFHQLHCLSGIRKHLLLLKGSIGRNNTQEIQEILLDPEVQHIYHCFDYIRQALMCAGDMTIEWPREEADGRRFAFDGWGIAHECQSWDAIMSYMSDHDVSNGF